MAQRPLHIAFIGARGVGNTYSGIERYYEEVGARLVQRGHHVTTYCRRHFTPDVPSYRGVEVRRLPSIRTKHLETLSHSLLSTFDSLRRRFDIIQFHAIGSAPLSLLPRCFGTTTIVSVRGLDWQRAKWRFFARTALRVGEWASAHCPTATVVVSATLERYYTQSYGRAPYLIPNAVDSPVRRPPTLINERFGLEKNGFFLYVGRLSPEKGIHHLLEAARPLAGRVNVVLAGGNSYSDGYIDTLRAAAWDGVLFLGNVDRDVISELHSNCLAFVLPSAMEGLSLSLLESVSYGSCIIASDIPENVEVLGDAGLTFPFGDVLALRTLLTQVLEDRDLTEGCRARAQDRARRQADWDEVTARTEALYYEVLNAHLRTAA